MIKINRKKLIILSGFLIFSAFFFITPQPNLLQDNRVEINNLFKLSADDWNDFILNNGSDEAKDLVFDSFGNVIVAGKKFSSNTNSHDIAIIKYSSSGEMVWNLTWGGDDDDEAFSIDIDSLNNVYITGSTKSYGTNGSKDICLLKYNDLGEFQWVQIWGENEIDTGMGVVEFYNGIDSSIYVVGFTKINQNYGDVVLLKYTDAGILVWSKTYGDYFTDCPYDISVDNSGNIYVVGNTENFDAENSDFFLSKYDSDGNSIFNKTWGDSRYGEARSLVIDSQNNIFVVGNVLNIGEGGQNIRLFKLDNTTGNLLWDIEWGGEEHNFGDDITLDLQGNIFIAGSIEINSIKQACVIKFNNMGSYLWQKTYTNGIEDVGFGIAINDFNCFYLTGRAIIEDDDDNIFILMEKPFPGNFILSSNAASPDNDGNFTLNWTPSIDAINYSVLQSNESIDEFNENVIEIVSGSKNFNHVIYNLEEGLYYFEIVAINEHGNTSSNQINVLIQYPPDDFILFDNYEQNNLDGEVLLNWSESIGADNYSVYFSTSEIDGIFNNGTLMDEGLESTSFLVPGTLLDFNYYFSVIAINEAGQKLSNCICIEVRKIPKEFTLTTEIDTDTVDVDGEFFLTWTKSEFADYYIVYYSSNNITDVNDANVEEIYVYTPDFSFLTYRFDITVTQNLTLYYLVVACNEHDTIYSECVKIETIIPSTGEDKPFGYIDYNGIITFLLIVSLIFVLFILVNLNSHKKFNLKRGNGGNNDNFYSRSSIRMGTRSGRKKTLLAISLLFILLSSFIIGCNVVRADAEIDYFSATPNPADVGEEINFDWYIDGAFNSSYINFGDGIIENVTELNSIDHAYDNPGRYQVMLYLMQNNGDYVNETIDIIIKNQAPQFDISFNTSDNSEAYEDEDVEISVINLIESDVDKEPGVLTYIYDFADGGDNQISTNESSVIHSWKNEGTYPVTITIIDDQGATCQNTKNINIINRPPIGHIGFGIDDDYGESSSEYIATYTWRDNAIGLEPEEWIVNNGNPYLLDDSSINVIIDEGSAHDKVVRLRDNSDQNSISMENSFSGQSFGTTEFWIKSEDIDSKTWTMSFWDDSNIAFQILTENGQWKYATSQTYNTIAGINPPIDNTWYHVRIDFCLDNSNVPSGTFGESNKFQIIINDIKSNIYDIDNVNVLQINRIEIQSGMQDIGTSFIDAIGYSWDLDYEVGDNRMTKINYPDKTLFLLNAAGCIDTPSDSDSLRYYWQFGDDTSAYGKYVYHQYSQSGLYRVVLTVKDDNGQTASCTRFISVNNKYPEINITVPDEIITIFEGGTIMYNTVSMDDITDMTSLTYWWDFECENPGFNQEDLDDLEQQGWKASNLYMDDFTGYACVLVKDFEDSYGTDSIEVEVQNVDPSLSIWDASIIANSSVLVSRSDLELNLNFSINLISNMEPEVQYILDFDDSESKFFYTNKELVSMSLSRDWMLIINSSVNVPNMSWFKYDYVLEFLNGEELIISSGKLFGGAAGLWQVDLNSYFYDNESYNLKYPLTFKTQVWDPSIDDIALDSEYYANLLLNIDTTSTVPPGYISSTVEYTLNDAAYNLTVFEQEGLLYANVSVSKNIASDYYNENEFPVSLDIELLIDPMFNISDIIDRIQVGLSLDDISILECVEAKHDLFTSVNDDDGGYNQLNLNYSTCDEIIIGNLSPMLIPGIPGFATGGTRVTIYADVWDYDLTNELREYFILQIMNNASYYDKLIIENLTTSEKIPENTHDLIETSNGTFYLIDPAESNKLYKSIDYGYSWTEVISLDHNNTISAIWHDRVDENIFIACSNDTAIQTIKIGISDDAITYSECMESEPERFHSNTDAISTESTSNEKPNLAIDNNDNIHIVWEASREILYKYKDAKTGIWSTTEFVSTESSLSSWNPSIAIDTNDTIHIVWSDDSDYDGSGTDDDIFYKYKNTQTGIWSTTEVVSTESSFHGDDPSIVIDRNDTIHIVWRDWTEYNGSGTDYDIFYKQKDAQTGIWSTTEVVSTESSDRSSEPSIAIDKNDTIHIVWHDNTNYNGSGDDYDIFYKQKNLQTGTWNTTEIVSTESSGSSMGSSIAIDKDDTIHIVWTEYMNYNGTGNDFYIVYKQKNTITGMWSAIEVVSTNSIGSSDNPSIAIDGNNNIHVIWHNVTILFTETDYDIFYKFKNVKSGSWNTTELVSTESSDDCHYPTIAIDSDGTVHIVWTELPDYNIYYKSYYFVTNEVKDIIKINNSLYLGVVDFNKGEAYMQFHQQDVNSMEWVDSHSFNMGIIDDRTIETSYFVSDGQDIYFLWQWSNESVEFWNYDCYSGIFNPLIANITNSDLRGTSLLPENQRSIVYDDVDTLSFLLKYTQPGQYPGTYSFEDEIGETGSNIDFINGIFVHNNVEVIEESGNHDSVLMFGADRGESQHQFNPSPSGIREVWFKTNDTSLRSYLYFSEYEQNFTSFRTYAGNGGYFGYRHNNTDYDLIQCEENQWYHLRWQWYSDFTFDWWIDGQKIVDSGPFINLQNNIGYFFIGSYGQTVYLDAWGDPDNDSNYNIGDNLISGNLIFNYNINLDEIIRIEEDRDLVFIKDRNNAPGSLKKVIEISGNKVYQIGLGGSIDLMSEFMLNDSIVAITENYMFMSGGDVYKLLPTYFSGNCSMQFNDGFNNDMNEGVLSQNFNYSMEYSTIYEGDLIFGTEGNYLIELIADDGEISTISGGIMEIDFTDPHATMSDLPSEIVEDQRVQLTSEITIFGSNETDTSDYRFQWFFGDGTYSHEQNPIHSWSVSGTYDVILYIIDCYGDIFFINKTITIAEQLPEIRGPFTFQGVEGQATVLDLEIYDSFIDDQFLMYRWYDSDDNELLDIRNNKKPIVILNDGEHVYKLEVEDVHGNIVEANITLLIEDTPPTVLISNYMYYGIAETPLELNAYMIDNIDDIPNMVFEWNITVYDQTYTFTDVNPGTMSTCIFDQIDKCAIYKGQVLINDTLTGKSAISTFMIISRIDSNLNQIPDDYEQMLDECGLVFEPGQLYDDTDGDYLIDIYETTISGTSPINPDTDGDGLYDGYDGYFIGEYTAGTDPLRYDTDGDKLNDYTEFLGGWNVTLELKGQFFVTSDPLKYDTDHDGLSDHGEYQAGANPRNPDTDNEGLTDNLDPFPTKIDGDDDGLTDFREYNLGTALDNSDTDGDSLSDGEEVIGWGFFTNPLDADSDGDFLTDSAEMQTYKFKLDDRYDLDESISLTFDEYCTRAAGAQIAITIAFGETKNGYGSEEIPDLRVIVTKADDDIVLLNETSNKTRYFSKAIDIKDLIENRSLDYRGEYVVSINDTVADCLLEQFEIEVIKYLDPNDPDYDDDKIMDGVETALLVRGLNTLNSSDLYYNNNLTTNNVTTAAIPGNYPGTHDFDYSMEEGKYYGTYDFDYEMEEGLYYGTYDFNNEINGTKEDEIEFIDEFEVAGDGVHTCEIISDDTEHKNILRVESTTGRAVYAKHNNMGNQSSGTIELYTKTNTGDGGRIYFLGDEGSNGLRIFLDVRNNYMNIYYGDGTGGFSYVNVATSGWAHVKITFDCVTDSWSSWVNGIAAVIDVPFYNDTTSANLNAIWIVNEGGNTEILVDAIGFSWDNWSHNGIGYEKGWNTNSKDILSLLEDNFNPLGTIINCNIGTIDEMDGHDDVIIINDTASDEWVNLQQNFNMNQTSGTIEWWWRTNDATSAMQFSLNNEGVQASAIKIHDDRFQYYDNTGPHDVGLIASDNTWYHMKIDFECSDNGYKGLGQEYYAIYIDGQQYGQYAFKEASSEIGSISFDSYMATSNIIYIDALGYSWDNTSHYGYGYQEGWNINPYDITPLLFNEFTPYIPQDCSIRILDDVDKHGNVIEINDDTSEKNTYFTQTFTDGPQEFGTIEYWSRLDDLNEQLSFRLYSTEASPEYISMLDMASNSFNAWNGSWANGTSSPIMTAVADTWYHVSIDFDCRESPGYMNLGSDQWQVSINGETVSGPYDLISDVHAIDRIMFTTYVGPSDTHAYIDSIAYSWDEEYSIGDNVYKDSNFESVGHYPGTYSFESDDVGSNPDGWDEIFIYEMTDVNVYSHIDGHDMVMRLVDPLDYSDANIIARNDFDSGQSCGTMEWWVRPTNASLYHYFGLSDGMSNTYNIVLNADGWWYYNGTWMDLSGDLPTPLDNTWIHIRVDFEHSDGVYSGLSQNQARITIDGISHIININSMDEISQFIIHTSEPDINTFYVDAVGYSWDPHYEIGDNLKDGLGNYEELALDVPDIGTIYDGDLSLKIESNGTPNGNGNIKLRLIKEDIDRTIDDVFLLDEYLYFDNTDVFGSNYMIDLKDHVENGLIDKYSGKYRLLLEVSSTEITDMFNVTDFSIITDTYVQAGPQDTEAWITDPAEADTDGDGWDDYYEIYGRVLEDEDATNPLSADTDGDGIIDSLDRDPLRDLYIEISPIYGVHNNLWFWDTSPNLEIVVKVQQLQLGFINLFGTNIPFPVLKTDKFITPIQRAHDTKVARYSWWWWGWHHLYHCRKAWFDGTLGSAKRNYYMDISDDNRQLDWLFLDLELWKMGGWWDDNLIVGRVSYKIGEDMTFNVAGRGFLQPNNNYMQVRVNTIGVERANTIAIHENGTVFNGHYQAKERMNVIQLYVKDTAANLAGTPFVAGPNIIVIPTSIFTETLLNARVQNEELDQTPLHHDDEKLFKFISVERDGGTEEACGEVDFVFVRFDISATDAMEVLELLLTCLVNDTTGETARLNNYSSTKEDGFRAVMMNLPQTVLGFVPWYCQFQNSAQGRAPKTFLDWLVSIFVFIVMFIPNLIITIGMAIIAIWEMIEEFVAAVLMAVVAALAYLLWCLIRVAILIITWIIFALTFLIILVLFISLIGIVYAINAFVPLSITLSINRISAHGIIDLEFEYNILFEYISTFDLFVPTIELKFNMNDFDLRFYLGYFDMDLRFNDSPSEILPTLNDNEELKTSDYSQEIDTEYFQEISTDNEGSNEFNNVDFVNGLGFGMGLAGGITATFAGLLFLSKLIHFSTGKYSEEKDINQKKWETFITVAGIIIFIASLIVILIEFFAFHTLESNEYYIGIGWGLIIAGICFFSMGLLLKYGKQVMAKWNKLPDVVVGFIEVFDIILALVGLYISISSMVEKFQNKESNNDEEGEAIMSLFAGIISVFLASGTLLFLGYFRKDGAANSIPRLSNQKKKSTFAFIFGGISIIGGFIMAIIFNHLFNTEDRVAPTITDNQEGDDTLRSTPGTTYDVDFSDTNSNLDNAQYMITTAPRQGGTMLKDWTNIFTDLGAPNYTDDWEIDFSACQAGINYISVRVFDESGNMATRDDVFYVIKD